SLPPVRPHPPRHLLVQLHPIHSTPAPLHRRPRPARRQLQQRRPSPHPPPPGPPPHLHPPPAQSLPLPLRVVSGLDLPVIPVQPPFPLVRLRQLSQKNPHRPSVDRDVVAHHHQVVLLLLHPHQRPPHHRPPLQVERRLPPLPNLPLRLLLPLLAARQVDSLQS